MTGNFYLGKVFDIAKGVVSDQQVMYDPADLTTHAVVTGMTGSGKTGLCIALLEEAALQGVPALIIDPKGDLTNLLLHFPDLAPQDFQPWIDPEMVRHTGKSIEQESIDTAQAWRNGLAEWGIDRTRMMALKNAAQFAVFTPGSDAGIPVGVLSSLQAPGIPWESNREILTEKITSTVTALLGLAGLDNIDPVLSREHILLSHIFQTAWSRNSSLDLNELILQIQTPPFEKLGAFPVDTFFPAKDRMDLALQLNNFLAAPSFELWRSGQPLDVASLLYMPDGKPRHSVFYLAHLSDVERMFFVTLLFSAVETWTRTQSGTSSLRALLYMDEIYGYIPPIANPASKQPLLRMLKQARAFGLGIVLSTQNPVDVDYKGLSNAGTWFIGKLQTDQDKQRLLDGLQSADGTLERSTFDNLISRLGKRVFILHNVHEKKPIIFQTRWAMNFLTGPLTPPQIPALNKLVGASMTETTTQTMQSAEQKDTGTVTLPDGLPAAVPFTASAPSTGHPSINEGSLTRPAVPSGIAEYFLPMNLSFAKAVSATGNVSPAEAMMSGIIYHPAIVASAQVRYLDRKYSLDAEQMCSALVTNPDRRGVIHWEDHIHKLPDEKQMDPEPSPDARFAALDSPINDPRLLNTLQKDFTDWIYRSNKLIVRANKVLGVYANPDVSQGEFMKTCTEAASEARDIEMAKATASLDRQISSLKDKATREERELSMDQTELSQRKVEEIGTAAESVFSLLGGRRSVGRKLSTSLTKRRLTEKAKSDVEESLQVIDQYKKQLALLEQERQKVLDEASSKWGDVANDITEIPIVPKKTDIYVNLFGVAWMPYYRVKAGTETLEIAAFSDG